MQRWERSEGVRREARGSEMWFKATSQSTHGRFSLMERTLPAGGRMPPAHRHTGNEEAYFVLDGVVTFRVAGEEFEGRSGSFVLVEAGEVHTFGNTTDEAARLLVLHAPALDGYFSDLESLWSRDEPPSTDDERALMQRHGMEQAELPLAIGTRCVGDALTSPAMEHPGSRSRPCAGGCAGSTPTSAAAR